MVAFRDETDKLTTNLTACSSEATTATPGTTSKRRGLTGASTVTTSHTRHAAAAANQGAYTAPVPNTLRQNIPSTNAKNAERVRDARKTTTRRSQQTLDKPSGPRETGEGVAEAALDEKYGPHAAKRRHE